MATYYLNADTGNDTTGDGSSGSPWLTVSKANTSSADGDIIVCQESTATYLFADINFTHSLTIKGENTDASGVVFTRAAAGTENWDFTQDMFFENFTVQDIVQTSQPLFYGDQDQSFLNVRFQNIDMSITSTGLIAHHGPIPSSHSLVNCAFSRISCDNVDGYLTGSVFSGLYPYEVICRNSSFHFLVPPTGWGVFTVFNKSGYQFNSSEITNCIFHSPSSVLLLHAHNAGWNTPLQDHTYSCFYNTTGYVDGGNNITSDPLFVDATNNNLNLRPASPCVDTGTLI